MKKQVSIIMAALLLSSCALQDNGGVGPDGDSNDKVLSVEQAETDDVSALYEGYKELQGKQIGEHIIMPDVIEPQKIENVYTFRVENNYDKTNLVERGTEFYKRFFGERFNADRLYLYEYEGDEYLNDLSYNSNGAVPEGINDPDNDDYGAYLGYPDTLMRTNTWFRYADNQTIIATYDPVKDKDVIMELENGKCTVGEACETVLGFFDREMKGFEGLKPKVSWLYYYSDTDHNKSVRRVFVKCALEKEGLSILDNLTAYWAEKQLTGGYQATYYSPIYYDIVLGGKDNLLVFQASGGPQKSTSENKVENVIPLKTAAELLDKNLAQKLLFKIEKVSLIYCRKRTTYYYENERELPYSQRTPSLVEDFRPTWVFEFAHGAGSLNVDAISGEITVDANSMILNDMYNQQNY